MVRVGKIADTQIILKETPMDKGAKKNYPAPNQPTNDPAANYKPNYGSGKTTGFEGNRGNASGKAQRCFGGGISGNSVKEPKNGKSG